jgi:hypothetical protein
MTRTLEQRSAPSSVFLFFVFGIAHSTGDAGGVRRDRLRSTLIGRSVREPDLALRLRHQVVELESQPSRRLA